MRPELYGGSGRSPLFLLLILALMLAGGQAHAQLDRRYYLQRAHTAYQAEQYTDAIATLRDYLDYRPDDRIALYLRALCKYQLRDHRGARRDLDRLLEQHPFAADALVLRGLVVGELGAPEEGLADLKQGVELRPSSQHIRFMRGIGYFMLKDYPAAIDDFSVMLRGDPAHLDARLNRGTAHLLKGDTLSARRDYLAAIIAHPFKPSPHIHLARLHYMAQHLDSAETQVEEALELDPKSGQALIIRALIQSTSQKPRKAIETLTKVIALMPQNSMAYYNRALLFMQLEDYRQAAHDLERASRISPRNIFIRYNRALAHLSLGQLALAEQSLNIALAIYPDFALAYGLRAEVRRRQGRMRASEKDHDKSRSLANRYRQGELGELSDTTRQLNQLIAFEDGFSTGDRALDEGQAGDRPLPMARIVQGGEQAYEEWLPIRYLDSGQLGGLRLAILPPDAPEGHSPTLPALDSLAGANPLLRPLASYQKAVADIDRIRFAPLDARGGIPSGRGYEPIPTGRADYREPIARLEQLRQATPSPYIDYTLATAHYLQRNPARAEALLTHAIERWPEFAEAYFNRGLIRLILKKNEEACLDLSRAGELGVPQAYRAIASSCLSSK